MSDGPGAPSPGDLVARAASRLQAASDSRAPCPPVRDLLGSTDIASAYAVQQLSTERRLAAGARIVGRKVGLTSPAVQRQLGVERPDVGVLFDDMQAAEDVPVPSERLLQPKTEEEIAFVLAADLDDGPLDDAQVRAAVDYAVAALEIVDSRVSGWDITITDTVADNASSGMFVLGSRRTSLEELEVEGAAHYLPAYAGSLDIMTSAALRIAERLSERALVAR